MDKIEKIGREIQGFSPSELAAFRFWSVRIGISYRGLGVGVQAGVLWFWIGSHADYDKLVG